MHFLDLRIKSYGCLKFQGEVWAGRASAAANSKKMGTARQVQASTRSRRATAG
jgi:hypothetical protein